VCVLSGVHLVANAIPMRMTDSVYFLSTLKAVSAAGRTCFAGIFKSWHHQGSFTPPQLVHRHNVLANTNFGEAATSSEAPRLPPCGVRLCDSPGMARLAERCPTRPRPRDAERDKFVGFTDDAWDWHLGDSETDEDAVPMKPTMAVVLERPTSITASPGTSVVGITSPRSVSSTEASSTSVSRGKDSLACKPPLFFADMPLVDGLRSLLLQQLKRRLSGEAMHLTADERELLEQHVERLHCYGQHIVETLSMMHLENGNSRFRLEEEVAGEPQPALELQPVQQQKALTLNDSEILEIYRIAQLEACKEADWRGGMSPGLRKNRTGLDELECLQVVSQAMQQPGQSPEGVAAQILASAPSSCAWYCRPDEASRHGTSRSIAVPDSTCETCWHEVH